MSYPVEPMPVVQMVDDYVNGALSDAQTFENCELFDESGISALHELAARIYALAWDDATRAAQARRVGAMARPKASS